MAGAAVNRTSFWGVTDPKLLSKLHIPVLQVWHASAKFAGFEDVEAEEDQPEMNQWNDVDMKPWLLRAPLSMDSLIGLPRHKQLETPWDVRRLVAIRNGSVYYLNQQAAYFPGNGTRLTQECLQPCNGQFDHWQKHMNDFISGPHKIPFPDVVFYLSVSDFPSGVEGLPAPVLSYQARPGFDDILVPILYDIKHPLYTFPWEDKVDKGFVRATPYCQCGWHQGFVKCARSYFAMRSLYENMGHIMEAGLTSGFGLSKDDKDNQVLLHGPLPKMGEFPLREHARYRYLLDTEGMSGSFRASKLMFFNSPIFKQSSPFYEWYTRSLVDGVHVIRFWVKDKDDIYSLIEKHRHNATGMQAMSLNAMKFAYKYCTETPRKFYWRRALARYKTLFPGMDAWMAAYNWTMTSAT